MGAVLKKICPCVFGVKIDDETEPLLSNVKKDGRSTPGSGYHTPEQYSRASSAVEIDTLSSTSTDSNASDSPTSGHFEQDVLFKQVLTSQAIKHAALVSYPQGEVKAANFSVKQKGVFDIIEALQGNTQAIAEYGIELSGETPTYIPGKLDEGKAIYATAVSSSMSEQESLSVSGGCTVFKTKKYVLITTFEREQDVAAATRITFEVADDLMERGQ